MNNLTKRVAWVLAVLFGLFVFMLGIWAVDIGVSAMSAGGRVVNGWWTRDPVQHYHIGLYLLAASGLFLSFSSIIAVHVDLMGFEETRNGVEEAE
ncbi:MAG: hypothetical protein ACLFUR_06640 [Candidatus Hadarchaeia archaeon]